MNKINFFYPVLKGGLIPASTILIANSHVDHLLISVNTGFILDSNPVFYQYEIYVNNFLFASKQQVSGFPEDPILGKHILNMTSNFTFDDVYAEVMYTFKIKLYKNNKEIEEAETTVFVAGGTQ